MLRFLLTCIVVLGFGAFSAAQTALPGKQVAVPKYERGPEVRLSGDVVQLPIVMVREYPFVEGEIAGVRGKLLLDTGAESALIVNDHRVPLSGGQVIGNGHFGSGQSYAVRLNQKVEGIEIGRLAFAGATKVQSQDARLLEEITPDFIGWLGHYFWQGYAFKLDYKRSVATFYKGGPGAFLKGEHILAVLPFTLRKLPNQPLVPLKLGKLDVLGAFDTGQYGTLYVNERTKAELIRNGGLRSVPGGNDTFDLAPFKADGIPVHGLQGIAVDSGTFGAAEPIGITEPNVLTLAYSFLKQYKTVWDYPNRKIYLLAP